MNINIYRYLRTFLIVTLSLVLCHNLVPSSFAQELNPNTQPIWLSTTNFPLYLPLISKNTDTDLSISFVEITQAVQNSSNSVTLVANRQTVVRVYTQSNLFALPNVYISISAYQGSSKMPGSPLVIGPGVAPLTWSRADISSSFNAYLPPNWLSGSVTLVTTVDPYDAIEEKNEANNSTSKVLNFTSVPALNITVVPVLYHHEPNGKTYGPASPTFIQSAFLRMYPVNYVNVNVHSTYYYSADLDNSSDWEILLNRITNLKISEEAPDSRVYYGLIPLLDGNGNSWWDGGYAGLGWLSSPPNQIWRESIGLADAYLKQYNYYLNGNDIVTHEVGHNQYGFDPIAFQVIPPTSYYDIMGYCEPNWISDYTYLGLLQNQVAYGAPEIEPKLTDSLYIRATIERDGITELLPFYAFPSKPDILPKESEYTLELVDASGEIMASYLLAIREADSADFQVQSIHTVIPQPTFPFTNIRLKRNGEIVSRRSNDRSVLSKTIQPLIRLDNGEIILQWGISQKPALVRYKTDSSETWTTLGIDFLDGEIRLDPQSLPEGKLFFEVILADATESAYSATWENIP